MDFSDHIKDKFNQYKDPSKAKRWFDQNYDRIKRLFEDYTLRDFIFEPFKSVFDTPLKTIDKDIYSVITQVAVINAVLAGLPGKMGVGIYVSMALEAWMAYSIAKHVGIEVNKPSDIWKYFGLLAGIFGAIFYLFRSLLGFGFSLFSFIPELNPLILAELFVTNLVGILFWVGFKEAKSTGSFTIPKRMLKTIYDKTVSLFKHQLGLLKSVFNMENIKIVGERLVTYLKGEIPTSANGKSNLNVKEYNGEIFSTAAMAYLLSGQYDKLEGPLGEAFMEAIRLRWSAQFDENTTFQEIADKFSEYDSDQLVGVISTVKGKMFEIMVTEQENTDGDNWIAEMHTDETFPGSDIIFTNIESGEQVEVSLKAVAETNGQIIEHALAKYPDIPIMTTDEAAALFNDDDMIFGSGISHEELHTVTQDNFDALINSINVNVNEVVIGGVTIGTMAALWPFTVAYLRKRITYEQLEAVYGKILGDSGVKLVSRISYATILGPIFAWYLLARGVKNIISTVGCSKTIKLIEYRPLLKL